MARFKTKAKHPSHGENAAETKSFKYSILLLALLGFVIWWMSANVVWLGDDLDYKYIMKGALWESWGKIETARDLFISQMVHYLHVNGRIVAHTLVQIFNAKLGQPVFAFCNGIVYALFALLLAKAGGVSVKGNPAGVLSAICLSVLCFITKMMPSCQIGFIWAMAVNIAWLLLFFKKGSPSVLTTVLMALFGVIAGNWQEAISIGVGGGVGIWWIIQLVRSIKLPDVAFDWHRSWMLVGYFIGTEYSCLSPATMSRVATIDITPTDQFLISLYSFPAVIILIIYAIHLLKLKGNSRRLFSFDIEEGKIPAGVLSCGVICLIIFNILIGIYSNRQLFGANMLASILLLRILPHHTFGKIINTVAALATLAFWGVMASGMREVRRQYDDIVYLHSQSKDGTVIYDRRRVMTFGFPLRSKYYEDILGQFNSDLHHSLMKDFVHTRSGGTLKLVPKITLNEERVVSYAPGHFNAVLKMPAQGEPQREVTVYGHYPFGIPAKPRTIKVARYSCLGRPNGSTVIIPDFPFFTADSVTILQ